MTNTQTFAFSDSIAIIIIAGLLSLLPVVALLWVYYVRQQRPTVSGQTVARFFLFGMVSVGGAVVLERGVYELWKWVSLDTASIFFSDALSFTDLPSLITAAIVAFGIVALAEEGVRYLLMRRAFRVASDFDQLIDGVQYGFALGLGFAFVENTLYFLQLFRGLDFDTLAIVFFLRFLISTVGHLSFGGVMGYCIAMAAMHPGERRAFLRRAFWIPWIMHGLFDTLLSVQLSFYTVLLLSIPLVVFWKWFQDDRMFELHVLQGRRLRFPIGPKRPALAPPHPTIVEAIPSMALCPNCTAPVGEKDQQCRSCGLKLYRKGERPLLPFLGKGLL